jgi:hypothetical protein
LSRGTRWLIALAIVAFVLTPVIASAATESRPASRAQVAAQPSSHTTRDIALAGAIVMPIVLLAGFAAGTGRRRRRRDEPVVQMLCTEPNADWHTKARVITNPAPEPIPAVRYQRSTTWA